MSLKICSFLNCHKISGDEDVSQGTNTLSPEYVWEFWKALLFLKFRVSIVWSLLRVQGPAWAGKKSTLSCWGLNQFFTQYSQLLYFKIEVVFDHDPTTSGLTLLI